MERIDLGKPRWNQDTFMGRLRHYANITDPRLVFTTSATLYSAKRLLQEYKDGREPKGTTSTELYRAQKMYQAAFHPDTGELQNVVGRMSFQVPGGTILIGAMLIWYKSNAAVVFWQWANQSFNALVNYTNRNAHSELTGKQIGTAYVSATTAALVTSLGLKHFLASRGGSLAQRFVPFFAVAAANCVNIPLMRQNELVHGVVLTDADNNKVSASAASAKERDIANTVYAYILFQSAAVKGITLVTISRILIASPSLIVTPIVMEKLEKMLWFQRRRKFYNLSIQVAITMALLAVMVPIGCALFPQRNSITGSSLVSREPHVFQHVVDYYGGDEEKAIKSKLFFNKGL